MSSTKTVKLSAKQRQLLTKGLSKPSSVPSPTPTPPAKPDKPSSDSKKPKDSSLKRKRDDVEDSTSIKPPKPSKPLNQEPPAPSTDLPGRLRAAQFRFINEMLYTTTSSEAVEKTKENPGLLLAYHEGFRHQVSQWPVNPVDVFIGELQSMLAKRARSNGHVGDEKLVVADLGCGEAKIAQSFKEDTRIKVHSYDLTAVNPYVTACDIARTPLASKSADVAIFCLSLMGTNYLDFVKEAVRMLKTSGQLRIAEVKSRISDTDGFVEAIESCGLRLQYKDSKNKMFELFSFSKVKTEGAKPKIAASFELKPCLYKKR